MGCGAFKAVIIAAVMPGPMPGIHLGPTPLPLRAANACSPDQRRRSRSAAPGSSAQVAAQRGNTRERLIKKRLRRFPALGPGSQSAALHASGARRRLMHHRA
ncbi:hypothetical protein XFLAVUS301_29420 [Xanthobacter flavus]|uniref:Uncharacterized protein n=1 Tax=Xanthobacter flavus TaxID=281 RepID=A0A9W6FMT2_XANFL|nr:hypothetical protein XFLAVUS301_29420 [Xanthobacter flavus]